VERNRIVCFAHRGKETLIVDYAAEPRENSQVFVITRGTNEEENIG
jgi:hypothetical protein